MIVCDCEKVATHQCDVCGAPVCDECVPCPFCGKVLACYD